MGSSSKKCASETFAYTSTIPNMSVQLSDPSLAFNSTRQRQTDVCGSTSEMAVVSPDPPISQDEVRDQQISEASPRPEQQPRPSTDHRQHPYPSSVSTFSWPVSPPLYIPPTEPTGASQLTVNPGAPVDLSVFDWNSIPNPLLETTISTSTCHLPFLRIAKAH